MTPFQTIVKMVLAETGLRWARVTGEERKGKISRARLAICWATREVTGLSYNQIARKMARDHSSIIYARRRGEELRATDPDFKAFTDRLVAAIPDKTVPE